MSFECSKLEFVDFVLRRGCLPLQYEVHGRFEEQELIAKLSTDAGNFTSSEHKLCFGRQRDALDIQSMLDSSHRILAVRTCARKNLLGILALRLQNAGCVAEALWRSNSELRDPFANSGIKLMTFARGCTVARDDLFAENLLTTVPLLNPKACEFLQSVGFRKIKQDRGFADYLLQF
ncbi:MAG TPA: hypothetical protein VJB60_02230 [Candidatus Peribacterales bacterium]|nr:hypothetical protein [Candidatus Peribacterales bacterium]